jgi:hypothetical protein
MDMIKQNMIKKRNIIMGMNMDTGSESFFVVGSFLFS